MIKVPLAASSDFSRENIRKFIVSDTFKGLLARDCSPQTLNANFVYPVSGSIGLAEVIDTFIDLNQKEILNNDQDADINKNFIPVFTDTLTYSTTLSGGTTGSAAAITLSPSGHGVRLGEASLSAALLRTDKHMLVIGLAFNPVKSASLPKATISPLGGIQPLKTVFAKINTTSAAEDRAIQAITQQRIDNFLDKAAIVASPAP